MPATGIDSRGRERAEQTVKLPNDVRRRLRISAAFLEREISEIVEDAVTDYLDRLDGDRRTRGLQALPRLED